MADCVATTGIADNITLTGATLWGSAEMLNYPTYLGVGWGFEWGLDESYGSIWVNNENWDQGNITISFSHDIVGLTPDRTYHFRAFAIYEMNE